MFFNVNSKFGKRFLSFFVQWLNHLEPDFLKAYYDEIIPVLNKFDAFAPQTQKNFIVKQVNEIIGGAPKQCKDNTTLYNLKYIVRC